MKISLDMWQNLTTMAEYYEENGYRDLPQPWLASKEAIEATLPEGNTPSFLGEDRLLGSAEQAFIDRMLDGSMPVGTWQALTPCFRTEDQYDALHHPYFMKLELINYQPLDPEGALQAMLGLALRGKRRLIKFNVPDIQIEDTDIGKDLILFGHEVGSYGVRTFQGHTWVYGTGLAEPRFTTVLKSGVIV